MVLPFAVYVLKCSNGQYYTGYIENITERIRRNLGAGRGIIWISDKVDKNSYKYRFLQNLFYLSENHYIE
ncbi:hypothetical protein GCM10010465_19590 [Actinomadura fibrosa]